jgi:hypothetical protein
MPIIKPRGIANNPANTATSIVPASNGSTPNFGLVGSRGLHWVPVKYSQIETSLKNPIDSDTST